MWWIIAAGEIISSTSRASFFSVFPWERKEQPGRERWRGWVKETELGNERQSKYRSQQNELQDGINFSSNFQSMGVTVLDKINYEPRSASLNTLVLFWLRTLCFLWLCSGDAPYCTPEQYKECADPALGKEITKHVCVCVYPTAKSPWSMPITDNIVTWARWYPFWKRNPQAWHWGSPFHTLLSLHQLLPFRLFMSGVSYLPAVSRSFMRLTCRPLAAAVPQTQLPCVLSLSYFL